MVRWILSVTLASHWWKPMVTACSSTTWVFPETFGDQAEQHTFTLPPKESDTCTSIVCVCFRMGKIIRPPERASSRRSFFILCWEFNGSACCSGFSLVIIPRLESFCCPPESQCGGKRVPNFKVNITITYCINSIQTSTTQAMLMCFHPANEQGYLYQVLLLYRSSCSWWKQQTPQTVFHRSQMRTHRRKSEGRAAVPPSSEEGNSWIQLLQHHQLYYVCWRADKHSGRSPAAALCSSSQSSNPQTAQLPPQWGAVAPEDAGSQCGTWPPGCLWWHAAPGALETL